MKILITTPDGKVGSEVAQILEKNGKPFVLASHGPEKTKKSHPKAEIVSFNFKEESTWKTALKDISTVYVAAPGDWPSDPVKKFIYYAISQNIKKFVYLSALGVDANEEIPLRQTELHLEKVAPEWTVVRPTWFMQNFSTGMAGAIKSGTLAEPAADGKTGFIDARDIAEVITKALTESGHNKKYYNLTGPKLLDRNNVCEIISKATGKPLKYAPISDEEFRKAMKDYMPTSYLELMSNLYSGVRAGWTAVLTEDVSKVLGKPPRSFEAFASDFADTWK
jgi:uncharacterized protein YbjT (DUF2867 family)